MELKLDSNKFDQYQIILASNIIKATYEELNDLGIPVEKLNDICSRIAFNICCLIDGCETLVAKGYKFSPILTFVDDDTSFNVAISCGGNSYMHEYVDKIIHELKGQNT